MEVAGDQFWLEAVETAEIGDGSFKSAAGLERIEVSDVLADEHLLSHADGDGAFQMPADGENWRQALANANSEGGVTASATKDPGAAAGESHYRIIAGTNDRAIVHQEMIGNFFQASGGFVVGDGNGLVASIAAGRNHWESAFLHQEMMKRRIREHDAQVG